LEQLQVFWEDEKEEKRRGPAWPGIGGERSDSYNKDWEERKEIEIHLMGFSGKGKLEEG